MPLDLILLFLVIAGWINFQFSFLRAALIRCLELYLRHVPMAAPNSCAEWTGQTARLSHHQGKRQSWNNREEPLILLIACTNSSQTFS